jgi:hypothetical protein
MDEVLVAKELVEVAKDIIAMPIVYETINGIKFYINDERQCKHNEAHVHVEDGNEDAVFSLVDGRKMRGGIKHETDVLHFLSNKSNRRRLLRRYNNYQKKDRCEYLVNPIL